VLDVAAAAQDVTLGVDYYELAITSVRCPLQHLLTAAMNITDSK
jgi:hypothetical protein